MDTISPPNKTVAAGNDSDPDYSEIIQNDNKKVQTEDDRRQQCCSSRASIRSQGSISFFVEFDDCDINGDDYAYSGNNYIVLILSVNITYLYIFYTFIFEYFGV